MVHSWWLWSLTCSGSCRSLDSTPFGRLHDRIGSGLIRRVVEETTNVMNEERIQLLCDLLFVGKVKSPLERDPRGR